MMHADQICYYSTLGDPKTAKTKDMGLLDRASIPLHFHDLSGTITNNHLSTKAASLKQLVFNVCKRIFFNCHWINQYHRMLLSEHFEFVWDFLHFHPFFAPTGVKNATKLTPITIFHAP